MWLGILLKALLFALLVPGVALSLPTGGSLREQALVHGLVFAIANHFVYLYVRPVLEGFDTFHPDSKVDQPCPPNSEKCSSGDCKLKSDIYGLCGYKP
jgi:hypothetical protein